MADAKPAQVIAEPQEPRNTAKTVRLSIPEKEVAPAPERPVIKRVRKQRQPKAFVPASQARTPAPKTTQKKATK
jgi:hypothetical protein